MKRICFIGTTWKYIIPCNFENTPQYIYSNECHFDFKNYQHNLHQGRWWGRVTVAFARWLVGIHQEMLAKITKRPTCWNTEEESYYNNPFHQEIPQIQTNHLPLADTWDFGWIVHGQLFFCFQTSHLESKTPHGVLKTPNPRNLG